MWPGFIMGTPQNNSGIWIGMNVNTGWSSHTKSTFNLVINGSQGYITAGNLDTIYDNDLLDISNYDGDINPGI